MLLFGFLEDEHERIVKLQNTEASCLDYWKHYQQLSPEEAAIAGHMIAAAGKRFIDWYVDDFSIIYPFSGIGQGSVNNGCGQMISINPHCFVFPEDKKLFYVRSDMWIPPERKEEAIPEWIRNLAYDVKCFSSGLADIRTEVIQFSFDDDPPCDYYAITFRMDKEEVKRRIKLADEIFYMANIGNYILTLTDIMGEYDACFGALYQGKPVVLERESIEFK